ncbi:MAG: biotin transporter BioY [Chloroflexota bacterium]
MNLQKAPDSNSSLALAVRPQAGLGYQLALVVGGSLLVALAAQIEIPMWPVPVTMQTFAVLLVGGLLGSRLGAMSLLLYLAEGALGLPVFAGGAGSVLHFAGPTAGYLFGFVAAAFVAGWLCERGWSRKVETAVFAMFLGTAAIYLFGLPWLAQFTGWDKVLQLGLIPFIPGDVLKVILAALALPLGWKICKQ